MERKRMQTRQLGKSDVQVTPVIFGAWAIGGWMWGGTEEKDSLDAIRASIDNGVNTIDTAAIYGMGYSEELVGKAIKGIRDKVRHRHQVRHALGHRRGHPSRGRRRINQGRRRRHPQERQAGTASRTNASRASSGWAWT